MPIKQYGDRLTVDDISSPFEAFGMTQEYKQGLVDKYNQAVFGDSGISGGVVGTFNNGTSGNSGTRGIRNVNASKYAPGTFNYNTDINLPTYKVGDKFTAPTFTPTDIESQLGKLPSYSADAYSVGSYTAPQYKAPVYNEGKVKALTQEQAAPAIRGLRSAIMRVQNQQGENQNVNKMTMRDALAGYGQGLQSAMAGASATARSLYNEEYGRKAEESKINFEAMTDAEKTSYLAKNEAAKTNYLAQQDAAKRNFEAQYDKYKMKWQDLSDAAKMNYTSKFNEAMQNYQSKLEEGKLNYQNLVDAKKLAYTAGLDVAKTNFATQADWKKTQYGVENQKAMAEYEAALKKYEIDTKAKTETKKNAPGLTYGGTSPSSSSALNPDSVWFDPSVYQMSIERAKSFRR